jgi:hypothetical protein
VGADQAKYLEAHQPLKTLKKEQIKLIREHKADIVSPILTRDSLKMTQNRITGRFIPSIIPKN